MVRRNQIQVSMTMYSVLHNGLDPLPSIACYVLVYNLLWTMLYTLNKAVFFTIRWRNFMTNNGTKLVLNQSRRCIMLEDGPVMRDNVCTERKGFVCEKEGHLC